MKNREDFQEYIEAFLKQNSYLNLISKNDEKLLWEKHIFDSLAIEKFFEKYFSEGRKSGGQEVRSKSLISGWGKTSDTNPLTLQTSTNNLPSPQPSPSRGEGACANSLSTIQPFNLSTNNNFPLSNFNFQLLDIGTGGGFPAVPIAIYYPEIEVFALDSIRKKINAIENIKAELGLKNLHTICDRAENFIKAAKQLSSYAAKNSGKLKVENGKFEEVRQQEILQQQQTDKNHSTFQPFNLSTHNNFPLSTFNFQFDIITSRAVAPIKVIVEYAMPLLKDDGYFIAYKSLKAQEEINDAKQVLKKHKAKVVDIIQYDLPLDENFTRNLVVIAKN